MNEIERSLLFLLLVKFLTQTDGGKKIYVNNKEKFDLQFGDAIKELFEVDNVLDIPYTDNELLIITHVFALAENYKNQFDKEVLDFVREEANQLAKVFEKVK